MNIAFYAPLKSPNHPVPSGDRLMARLIIRGLALAGHEVRLVSEMRSFLKSSTDFAGYAALLATAEAEIARLADLWQQGGAPDLWFCYHPYYKAPDLLGPRLAAEFDVPMVTAEASYSQRRNTGVWIDMQAEVLRMISAAAVNISLTARDQAGLLLAAPGARTTRLRPFIDTARFAALPPNPTPNHLICVAMMRPGDKLESYTQLAASLALLPDLPWTLSIVGDGPSRHIVEELFAGFSPGRLQWHGLLELDDIAALLARSALYVWPGYGEAYGLAYLEAQAAGLPIVACNTAGVPEVVQHNQTGVLTVTGDDAAFAAAVASLLTDPPRRMALAQNARKKTLRDHALGVAASHLDAIVRAAVARRV